MYSYCTNSLFYNFETKTPAGYHYHHKEVCNFAGSTIFFIVKCVSKGELKSLLKLSIVLISVERIIFIIVIVVFDSSSSGRSHKSH